MDQNSHSDTAVPAQTTSPEEDATLLAIEALEARSVDPNPRPLNAPREVAVPPRQTAPLPPAGPKVMEPVVAKPLQPKPAVVAPAPVDVKPVTKPIAADVKPVQKPTPPPVPTKPKKPATPSEEMAEALASAPASSGFQFFANQKPPRKSFVIVGIVVVIIGAGVAAYFTLR